MTKRGTFIAFEGGEGTGKSTQARLLAQALSARGIDALVTREPGGTPGAEAIRALLLDGPEWEPRAEALLFAAARSDHVARAILPALDAGRWVICDRFVSSSRAYQGGAGALGDAAIMNLHMIGSQGVMPDCTILMEVAPQVAAARIAARDGSRADNIGGRDARYHAEVAAAFVRLAEADPQSFIRIDGNGTADESHAAVIAALAPLFAS